MLSKCPFLLVLVLFVHVVYGQQSSLVKLNPNGTLTYIPETNGNTIPDFSAVGYRRSDADLPNIPVVKTISASTSGSSRKIIQDAIDEVSAMPLQPNGFRGAILCKKGTYYIEDSIKVLASGIVIRGEGENTSGTKWIAAGKGQRALLHFIGIGSRSNITSTRSDITDAFVPVGTFSFNVSSTAGYAVGDEIVVVRPGTDKWIKDLKMDVIEDVSSPDAQWRASQYHLYFERQITKIDGKRIYVDNPMVQQLETQYGGGYICKYSFPGRIQDVGVEYIQFESEYASNTDEDHGWNAVKFTAVQHGFARNIVARYFGYAAVFISGSSKYVTVKNCKGLDAKSLIEGSRRYTFNIAGRAQLNLITGCYAKEGRHDYVTGARTAGPNVFHNSSSENAYSDVGPHQRWATGTLYDNITTTAVINVQDRGAAGGNGHGWTGVTQVLWNCTSTNKIAVQSPWVSGKNYAIAVKGLKYPGNYEPDRPDGFWELRNSNITPSSLFEAQLNARRKTLLVNTSLSSFIGELQSTQITIRWATANEQNLTSFELKYSTDNMAYSTIQTISVNNNNASNGYNFIHTNISTGTNYYKLVAKNATEQTELPYIIMVLGTQVGNNILFKQDFEQAAFVADYVKTLDNGKSFFNAVDATAGTDANNALIGIADGKLVLQKTANGSSTGTAYFARTTDFLGTTPLFVVQFDMDFTTSGTGNSGIQFFLGSNFAADGQIENDVAKLYSRITFNMAGSDGFKVRANANTNASNNYSGPQTIRWVVNATTSSQQYIGPDNNTYTLEPNRYNVWVGNQKQFSSNISASNPSVAIQNFKFILTGGPTICKIDNIEIKSLPTALPVTLTAFTGKALNYGVALAWQTVTEQNNSHFEIYKRDIKGIYERIGNVLGKGNSQGFNSYSFIDEKPLLGINYYKLKQLDFDGKTDEFGPIAINHQLSSEKLWIYQTNSSCILVFNSLQTQQVTLYIADINGRKVYHEYFMAQEGSHKRELPIVAKGLMVAVLSTETGIYRIKFTN